MFVIRQERKDGAGEPVSVWLKSAAPVKKWGDQATAMRFATNGDARRAAVRLIGAWFVEPV